MTIDKQKIDYYKRKQAGKGNFGLFFDALFFDIAIFVLVFLLLLRVSKLLMLAVIIAGAVTVFLDYMIRYLKSKKLEKYVIKELIDLRHQLLIEKILLKSSNEKHQIVINAYNKLNNITCLSSKDPDIFINDREKLYVNLIIVLPPKKAGIKDIIAAVEYMENKRIEKAVLGCTTSFDDSAVSFIEKSGFDITLIEQSALLESAMDLDITILDDELKKALNEKIENDHISRKRFLSLATSSNNVKRFSIFGLFLFVLASFTPFRAYYYTVSVACFIFAIVIYVYNIKKETKDGAAI